MIILATVSSSKIVCARDILLVFAESLQMAVCNVICRKGLIWDILFGSRARSNAISIDFSVQPR